MKKMLLTMLLITLGAACLMIAGCTPIEQNARDAAAALGGSLAAAQAKYQATCTANPAQTVCTTINRGVAGQNALVTAVETYCGWSTTAPPADMTTKCVPVKSAEGALTSAIANANRLTLEVKEVL